MYLKVLDHPTYCYTGGKAFDAALPTVIFIHGVLNDHSVWGLQSRYFAHHGWNVLAIDLPGHCRSGGEAPASVEQAADFVLALMDAEGIVQAALVGHSWGSLIALEAASRLGPRVTHLALIGTAFPMPVSTALLDAALNDPLRAIHMINVFSRSTLAPPPSALGPGTWVWGASLALHRRVLASNGSVNLLHRGFNACDRYRHGEIAIDKIDCPVLFVLGKDDQMTRPRDAQGLIDRARACGKQVNVARLAVGHHQMTEAPDHTLLELKNFLI
jgi:pimeloyl-ACP methyl ester carboxylesterase